MPRRGVDIHKVIAMARRVGEATQGLVALWTGRAGITAYLVFRQLRELCEDGYLDTDGVKCIASKDRIVFRKLNGGEA